MASRQKKKLHVDLELFILFPKINQGRVSLVVNFLLEWVFTTMWNAAEYNGHVKGVAKTVRWGKKTSVKAACASFPLEAAVKGYLVSAAV